MSICIIPPPPAKQGFSLVELSIVLVILGLLIGGILSGQALIRAAELRSVSTDLNRFNTAIYTFRDKYFALPGDMTNATQFWGNAGTGTNGGECATPDTSVGTGTQTCNGNGDGRIMIGNEGWRAWQHLANAGLIEGSYTGVGGSVPGSSVPASRFKQGGFDIMFQDYSYYQKKKGSFIQFGTYGGTWMNDSILQAQEIWQLDMKMDDGVADSGKLYGIRGLNSTGCVNGGWGSASANYVMDDTSVGCRIFYWLD